MKYGFAILAVAGAIATFGSPAQAKDYPWCAVRQGAGQYGDCHYTSFQQCSASVTIGETCIRNALAADEGRRGYRR